MGSIKVREDVVAVVNERLAVWLDENVVKLIDGVGVKRSSE